MKHCIQSLFYTIVQTSRICDAFFADYFAENADGVTADEFIILDTVYCYPEICQRDLAKLILKGTSHTSKFLAALEKKGFIQRPIDTKGNRVVKKIVITQKGMEVYEYASKIALNFAKHIESSIGAKNAIDCTVFLNKLKNTLISSTDIIFE